MLYVDISPDYDDWRAERDAEEGTRGHDARTEDKEGDESLPF